MVLAFSFEPVLVSWQGGAVGHLLYGLRIRRVSTDRNLNLLVSYLRLLIKIPLGVMSLVSVLASRKHQALHDLVCRSVVVLRQPENHAAREGLDERVDLTELYNYPSRPRRGFVTFLYVVLLAMIVLVLGELTIGDECVRKGNCSVLEAVVILALNVGLTIGLFVVTWLGFEGRLPGARRLPKIDSTP